MQWLGGQGGYHPPGINFVGKIRKYFGLSANSENSNASNVQLSDLKIMSGNIPSMTYYKKLKSMSLLLQIVSVVGKFASLPPPLHSSSYCAPDGG